ncbi:hypothetical protein GOB78_03130 [Sinorhizobium meliloti]|nr:hypothetical protein [Sinorhizobium meliloti]
MFATFLRFAENRTGAPDFMPAHNDWIAQGFADGGAAAGGAILAHGESRDAYDARIAADPFVVQRVVTAETYEIDPKRTAPVLDFLKSTA